MTRWRAHARAVPVDVKKRLIRYYERSTLMKIILWINVKPTKDQNKCACGRSAYADLCKTLLEMAR
eukprot:6077567-Pleurochrysis_carterae.AAC.1